MKLHYEGKHPKDDWDVVEKLYVKSEEESASIQGYVPNDEEEWEDNEEGGEETAEANENGIAEEEKDYK